MKLIPAIFILFFWVCTVQGQSTFTTLNPADKVFFLSGHFNLAPYDYYSYDFIEVDTLFQGLRIDSVSVNFPGDTTFFFNTIKRDFFHSRKRTEAAQLCDSSHWMGVCMRKKADGTESYMNGVYIPITYKVDALPGESWVFYHDESIGTFWATMDSTLYVDMVLGLPDTIYTIRLQLVDGNQDPIEHKLNGRTIKIGKRSGLITPVDHYHFPYDTTWFSLCGTLFPQRGITEPSMADIYDFNVGDEFHYEYAQMEYHYPGFYSWEYMYNMRIVDSIYYLGGVKYYTIKIIRCLPDSLGSSMDTFAVDTAKWPEILPFEQNNQHTYTMGRHHIQSTGCETYDIFDPAFDLLKCHYCSTDGGFSYNGHQTGLGEVIKGESGNPVYGWPNNYTSLQYFKKVDKNGNIIEESGSPVILPDCYNATASVEPSLEVDIFPNPVVDFVTIISATSIDQMNLYSMDGRLVSKLSLSAGDRSHLLSLVGLPSGIYYAHVIANDNIVVKKILKN